MAEDRERRVGRVMLVCDCVLVSEWGFAERKLKIILLFFLFVSGPQ